MERTSLLLAVLLNAAVASAASAYPLHLDDHAPAPQTTRVVSHVNGPALHAAHHARSSDADVLHLDYNKSARPNKTSPPKAAPLHNASVRTVPKRLAQR